MKFIHPFRGGCITMSLFSVLALLAPDGRSQGTAPVPGTQQAVQSIPLQPGWNSIYLEVEPANRDPSTVFQGVDLDSLWTHQARLPAVDFVQDPSEPVWNRDQWLVFVPTNRVEAFQNNLHQVLIHHSYLVKLNGSTPVTVQVTGRPALHAVEWTPDAFNYRGFPIDPSSPPTFHDFFRHSTAHYNAATSQLQQIYRLNTSGQWTTVGTGDLMKAGEAYWVFCKGPSDYLAPLSAKVAGDGLDFGLVVPELEVQLINRTASARNAIINDLNSPSLFSSIQLDTTAGFQSAPLPSSLTLPLTSSQTQNLRLMPRRQAFTSGSLETILSVEDGAGTRFLVPVAAQKKMAVGGASALAGLWLGNALITGVAEANSTTPTVPRPTGSELNLRLLIHVDANGQARLLREVIQLFQSATFTTGADGVQVESQPRREVLVTDDKLIHQFEGGALRDGQAVGRRFSTATFDFPPDSMNTFPLTGSMGGANSLHGTISISPGAPANPFRHKYHPDHDNKDAHFSSVTEEAYAITRQIQLTFSATAPLSGQPITGNYGYDALAGVYRETISGLHRTDLFVQGSFNLQRVSTTGVLNQ